MHDTSIRDSIREVAERCANKPMVTAGGETLTYGEALRFCRMRAKDTAPRSRIMIALPKGIRAYQEIFFSIVEGHTLVPTSMGWSAERMLSVMKIVRPDQLTCRSDLASKIVEMVGQEDVRIHKSRSVIDSVYDIQYREPKDDAFMLRTGMGNYYPDFLYTMFTSGTTGVPKGVPISVANISHYLDAITSEVEFQHSATWSQVSELSFDLSMHDIALCWKSGGHLVSIPSLHFNLSSRYVQNYEIENWLSVPSLIANSADLGLLQDGTLTSLKNSFFCGEDLSYCLCERWKAAAPNTRIFNLYGPTETTIAVSIHEVTDVSGTGSVPIGKPLGKNIMAIDGDGQLLIEGPQIFHGYLNIESSGIIERDDDRRYETGDICRRNPDGTFEFLTRIDSQIKYRGVRTEIKELELLANEVAGVLLCIAVPFSRHARNSYSDLALVVVSKSGLRELRKKILLKLPAFYSGIKLVGMTEVPRNSNGKIDRRKLRVQVEDLTFRDGIAMGPSS